MKTEVLIAGAGPTGLTLALWLAKLGVSFRIIDKATGPGETSRALAVQSRTLEFHRQIGIVDDVLAAGVKIDHIAIRTPNGVEAKMPLGKFGQGLSPYPYAFALPQDIHERVLLQKLAELGINVERETELVSFTQNDSGVTAIIAHNGASETVEAGYLCGADGAHSVVRHGLGLEFPGGAYKESFYVADVTGTGDVSKGGMDVSITKGGFCIIMPVRQYGSVRLIGVVPKAHEANVGKLTFEDIRDDVERASRLKVDNVNWLSTYRVHHRVAEHFRVGRCFIMGDAGHVHSPAGGQGMNTGIGDSVNLAWKLAAVTQGRADARILDTYEPERIAFAHTLIKSTDTAFRFITSMSPVSSFLRLHVLPKLIAIAASTKAGGHAAFNTVSQIRIRYRDSALSEGAAGKVRAGDRLPYLPLGRGDNHAPLEALDWQMHVYGKARKGLATALRRRGIALHELPWSGDAKRAGFCKNAAYLLRPDGYIALISENQSPRALNRYLDSWKIVPRAAQAATAQRTLEPVD